MTQTVAPIPSGESPDGTGGSPVLPGNDFSDTLWIRGARMEKSVFHSFALFIVLVFVRFSGILGDDDEDENDCECP